MNNFLEIENEIKEINKNLKDKYDSFFKSSKEDFREDILKKIGEISKLEKLKEDQLKNFGIVVGVDGSVNKMGGNFPHYLELYRALAKPTKGEDIYLNRYYTPLTDSIEIDVEQSKRRQMLAAIEVDVAIQAIKEIKPRLLMMDGGLIRYKIDYKEGFEKLVDLCKEKDIILIGVLKELKTNVISRAIGVDESIFDRELLYGKLNIGDFILIDDAFNKKSGENEGELSSGFLRTSNSAMAIGIDILSEQKKYIKDAANLVYSLTPYNSRGVPLWLDIVDKEVRVTDQFMKSMLEEYMDRDIYERFFISERDRRSLWKLSV